MSRQRNPGRALQEFTELRDGLAASPPGGQSSLVVGGEPIPVSDLVVELDGYVKAYKDVDEADDNYKIALAARSKVAQPAHDRRKLIRVAIKGVLGPTNPLLTKYGMPPDKLPEPLTTAKETVKVAKTKATRAARHTMGKRQKLAIKGEVPPAPPPAPPAPPDKEVP